MMSRPLPWGIPSTMSMRTTSASSWSTRRWARVAPTLPAPTTVTFLFIETPPVCSSTPRCSSTPPPTLPHVGGRKRCCTAGSAPGFYIARGPTAVLLEWGGYGGGQHGVRAREGPGGGRQGRGHGGEAPRPPPADPPVHRGRRDRPPHLAGQRPRVRRRRAEGLRRAAEEATGGGVSGP